MSSGELPLEVYHRTNAVGSGSFGSVVVVYDDDGEEYAMKLFDEEDEGDGSEDSEDYGISLGALREISILRFLREENSHPNIIAIHDVQTAFGEEDDEEFGTYAMAMPLFPDGSLANALSKITTKKQKVEIARGIINAIAYLHENSIIHRDIKSDNILLRINSPENKPGCDTFDPVLIDFSLAKFVNAGECSEFEPTHTPSMGTPTYKSPEVVAEEPYGLPSDMWSVGVVLLELLQGKCIDATRDKAAIAFVSGSLERLPEGQPFPSLLRGLLETDPKKRWTARQALDCDLFTKFQMSEEADAKTFRQICLSSALPIEGDQSHTDFGLDKENKENLWEPKRSTPKKKNSNPVILKRDKLIRKICKWMEWENPMTAKAAMQYSSLMNEIVGNVDDLNESNILLDCLVLAHKFFEQHFSGTSDLDELYNKFGQGDFDAEDYAGNENSIFAMMDFCLYPR
ncbi:unnamed protein product [Pseudo-nitzschia multistriata]|uniref:Protein kinase domain-containing protein n=1 Tax=Pseudo-nitzschia multistriata TaxID=183589 RepID=A0A448ZP20_9STRA|nr:unnamed protein product [Pseudo-nitzschia multistriata]